MSRALHRFILGLWCSVFALPGVARAQCADRLGRLDLVEEAERALVEADLAGADLKLRELEQALACGALAESEILARMWLVEAAWLTLQGDANAAKDSWRSAARVAPGIWVDAYGEKLRQAYQAAIASPDERPSALITLDPPLFSWVGAIDGVVVQFPATVTPGLHLVQVGANDVDISFARMLVAFQHTPSVVVTGVIEPLSAFDKGVVVPDPAPLVEKPVREQMPQLALPRASLYAAVGTDLAVGRQVSRGPIVEPSVKLTFPLETGVVLRPGLAGSPSLAWVRGALSAAPLASGQFLYDDQYGDTASVVALGGHLAGGGGADLGDLGLLVGFQWPDRIPIRGVVGGRLRRLPMAIEGRLGMNAAIGRTPEPAFDVVFSVTPYLFRVKAP